MFMSGVTRRFPTLKFGFLESGVGWACNLYADMIGHWEKRNGKKMDNYDPANLNPEQLLDLYQRYGGKWAEEYPGRLIDEKNLMGGTRKIGTPWTTGALRY